MAAWGSLSPGKRMLILVLGGGMAAGAAVLVLLATQQSPTQTVVAAVPDQPVAVAAPSGEAAPLPEPAAAPLPEPALPRIDTWRVAADGEALVAGIALPGATVAVLVDDQPVAEGMALASGEFVLQFTLPPNPSPSLLWLTMALKDDPLVVSSEIVALAPIKGPDIAAPPPEPEAEPSVAAAAEPAPVGTAAATPAPEDEAMAPSALLVTEEGAVVLQDAAAADPALTLQVTVDTITYTPQGEVQIGGRGAAAAALRLYLDNGGAADASVADDGRWLVTLGDVAPGVYTLRVDQLDATGKVTSRYETPFKRETLEALALASGAAVPKTALAAAEPPPPVEVTPDPPASASPASAPLAPVPEPEPELSAGVAPEAASAVAAEPAGTSQAEPASAAGPVPQPPVTITVQPGFTLWGIAQDRLGDGVFYVQVYEANRDKIRDPNLIYPGQVISLPGSPAP